MAITIMVGGVDFTNTPGLTIDMETIQVTNTIAVKSDTMDFDVKVDTNATTVLPDVGEEVIFTSPNGIEFGGVIVTAQEEEINPQTFVYHCEAKDYTYYLDRRSVVASYDQTTTDAIIRDVVTRFGNAGGGVTFTMNNVQPGYTIAPITFDDVFPSDVIKMMADESDWFWYVDYNKDIHFAPLEQNISPLPGNTLYADTDLVNFWDLTLKKDVTQLRNRIFLKNIKVRGTNQFTQGFTGNGSQNWFPLGFTPQDLTAASQVVATVNGVTQANYWENVDGSPGDGKPGAFFCDTNLGVRISPTPPNGAPVNVSFLPEVGPLKIMVEDAAAQAYMAAREAPGSDGVHEYVINDPNMSGPDTSTAQARGQFELYKYAYPYITGEFFSYTPGWFAGQYFTLQSNKRWGGFFSGGQTMYVTQVVKKIMNAINGVPKILYDITIASIPYSF